MPDADSIKLLIADDHKLFRIGLIKMLSDYHDIVVIDEAENGKDLVDKYFELKPSLVLTDISMPILSGIEAAKKVKSIDKDAKILFLSMYYSEEYIYLCLTSGGLGIVNKNILEEELVEAIRKVFLGEKYFGKNITKNMLEEIIHKYESSYVWGIKIKNPDLSKRELEVLKLIGDGYTSAEIANKLFIDIRTVDTHRTHIMHKLDLKSLSELIRFAVQFNLSLVD